MSTRSGKEFLDQAAVRNHVAGMLRTQAREFSRLARALERRLADDPVHDLRVLTRRMRSALWVAARLAPEREFRLLRNFLRGLGAHLGARRLLDVAAEDAREFGLDGARLHRRRAREGAALFVWLGPVHRAITAAALKAIARLLPRATDNRLPGALDAWIVDLRKALENAPNGPAEMHQLRIEAKKTRYLLEALGRSGDFIRELQRHLGRMHDLETLQELYRPLPIVERSAEAERSAARQVMRDVITRAEDELTQCVAALRGEVKVDAVAPATKDLAALIVPRQNPADSSRNPASRS